jgi:hypothetical protein
MNSELKYFIESNYDFLVKLYNRYVGYVLRDVSDIEYYASPYMNLIGYPSYNFIYFCKTYYNKKYNKKLSYIVKEEITFKTSIYLYIKLVFLFLFSHIFFKKKIKKNSIVIHGFHSDNDFKISPYKTIKTPPLRYFRNKNIYHDINISFVSLKSLLKYKKNNVTIGLVYLTFLEFIKLHYTAYKIFIKSKKINIFSISYVKILYTLIKGVSAGRLINNLDEETKYLHMFENRGYHLIADLLVKNHNKSIFLNLGISFRLAPEYMMFKYPRHTIKSKFLFMSKFNYDLVKKSLGDIDYKLFKNYRIDCKDYRSNGKENSILIISPLSMDVANALYKLILNNKNKELKIKIKLHPYLNKDNFDTEYIEYKNIYESLDDYNTIVYAGITTASIELYFQSKNIYKFVSDEFIDIDPLVDNNLVKKIKSLEEIQYSNKCYTKEEKDYYLGCSNKNLKEILKELD